jgi:hypothetical protein
LQYEYRTLVIPVGFVGHHREDLDRAGLDSRLAELGAEGWDLCMTLADQPLRMEDDGHVLIFKRLVESPFEESFDEEFAEEELAEEELAEEELADEELADEEFADEEHDGQPIEEAFVEQEPVKEKPTAAPNGARAGRRRGRGGKRQGRAPQARRDCLECGRTLREGAKFCGYCGTAGDDTAA